jgi:hypothetical protein
MENYPWYKLVNNHEKLMQGDFIINCPIIVPPSEITDSPEVEIIEYDVIIMSQSCDLVQEKLELVLVCPVFSLSEFEKKSDFFRSTKGKEALRQGNVPGYHLLNKCEIEEFERDFLVVDFRSVYSVPFVFLKEYSQKINKRLRLLPPYREHLSQAFARFFMRVGLPVDIPKFKKK